MWGRCAVLKVSVKLRTLVLPFSVAGNKAKVAVDMSAGAVEHTLEVGNLVVEREAVRWSSAGVVSCGAGGRRELALHNAGWWALRKARSCVVAGVGRTLAADSGSAASTGAAGVVGTSLVAAEAHNRAAFEMVVGWGRLGRGRACRRGLVEGAIGGRAVAWLFSCRIGRGPPSCC